MLKYSNSFLVVIFISILFSCSKKFQDYESNWMMTKLEIEGVNSMGQIMSPNFSINVKRETASLPALYNEVVKGFRCDVKFYKEKEKDFVEILGHHLFSGKYEIKCMDNSCCEVSMANSKVYIELCYNGDIPYGVTRNCPCKENFIRSWLNE